MSEFQSRLHILMSTRLAKLAIKICYNKIWPREESHPGRLSAFVQSLKQRALLSPPGTTPFSRTRATVTPGKVSPDFPVEKMPKRGQIDMQRTNFHHPEIEFNTITHAERHRR